MTATTLTADPDNVRYWCVDCKVYVPESEIHSVYRPGRGALVAHKKCGGDMLYYDPADDCFYVPLPGIVFGVPPAAPPTGGE